MDIGQEEDIYIPRVKWTEDPNVLAFYRMNRHQNKLELLLSDAGTGISHVIYTEESKTYIEINDHWHFLKNNSVFLLTSEKSGFRHIYVYTIDGKPLWQLTSGNWEVTDIAGVDEENNKLYYVSTEASPP